MAKVGIFVSYARRDAAELALRLQKDLTSTGFARRPFSGDSQADFRPARKETCGNVPESERTQCQPC
jgi:hypothetical protein